MDLYNSGLYAIMGVLIVVILIIAAVALLLYVLRSIGLMSIARNRGLRYPWLAWIPIVGSYTLGAIADDIESKNDGKGIFRFLLLGGGILSFLLSGARDMDDIVEAMIYYPYALDVSDMLEFGLVTSVGSLISIAYFVVTVIALNKLYKCYRPQSATGWTVLSAIPFTAFMQSIFPFVLRNSAPATHNAYGNGYGYPPPPYDDRNR